MTRKKRKSLIPESGYAVMGIDPSLNGTGICVPSGYTDHLKLNSNKSNTVKGMSRVARVACWVKFQLYEQPVTHVCMEGYAMNAKGRTHDIAELHSVVKLLVLKRGIPIIIVPPTTLKKWVAGHGFAKKPQMIEAVNRDWGVDIVSDDEADAYGLMRFGEAYLNRTILYEQDYRNQEALDKANYLVSTEELQMFAI